MSNVRKVSITLTPENIAMLEDAVDTGEYTSTSEVVRDALRLWKSRRAAQETDPEELRSLWLEGLSSGRSTEGKEVFGRLRAKYAKSAATETVSRGAAYRDYGLIDASQGLREQFSSGIEQADRGEFSPRWVQDIATAVIIEAKM